MLRNVTFAGKSNYFALMMSMGISASVLADTIDRTGQEPYEKCGYCHEYDGNSRFALYPNLAGQTQAYIVKQLKDFRAGHRVGDMQAMAEILSDQDIEIVARYFSEQMLRPVSVPTSVTDSVNRAAEQLFLKGDDARAIPACVSCHGQQGQGMAAIPRLAGQHAGYLAAQLQAFKSGSRRNDPNQQMQAISRKLTDQEIEAIAQYLHALPLQMPIKSKEKTISYNILRQQKR